MRILESKDQHQPERKVAERDRDLIEDDSEPEVAAPFSLRGLDQTVPQYANILQMNYDPFAFHVVLAQITSPIIVNEEDRRRFLEEGWVADVVSRLVIPPSAFRDMLRFMQQQLEQYEAQYGGVAEPDVDGPGSEESENGS